VLNEIGKRRGEKSVYVESVPTYHAAVRQKLRSSNPDLLTFNTSVAYAFGSVYTNFGTAAFARKNG